ncbi:MAG: hypothetical protein Q9227_007512 [Pyrenula ochraceoflavens]
MLIQRGQTSWRGGKGGSAQRRQNSGPKDRNGSQQDRRDNRLQGQNKDGLPSKPQEKVARAPVALPQELHTPVNDYNAREVEESMQKGSANKGTIYKLSTSPTDNTKTRNTGGPWASKPNTMSNGKDFFLELRKQVTAARNSGGSTLGG